MSKAVFTERVKKRVCTMKVFKGRAGICLHGAVLLALAVGVVSVQADSGAVHQTLQDPRPILLGTSGGNINDIDDFCCSGTLGSLVKDTGGTLYILGSSGF